MSVLSCLKQRALHARARLLNLSHKYKSYNNEDDAYRHDKQVLQFKKHFSYFLCSSVNLRGKRESRTDQDQAQPFRYESCRANKEEEPAIPFIKSDMRKAVVAEGGLDRDSTYFGGSTKKETCLTMPFISFENDLAQRILESECSYIYLVEFYCKCCILIGYTLVALVAIYQLLLYTQALDMSYSAI